MKIYRIANEKSLFDDDPNELKPYMIVEIKLQDDVAAKSPIFKKILDSEIKEDPVERYRSTNNPESKTRNALITRHIYKTQEEWENNLLTNPFYKID